jgi:aminoglycoside phosphotransferase (APT) family kinase protein
VRAGIEAYLGSPVVDATNQRGGFSPGVAARLRTASGITVFAKAAGPEPNEDTPRFHRREANIAAHLPAHAPVSRLLWTHDEGERGWIALVYADVAGRQPVVPWQASELQQVMDGMVALHQALTPSPITAPAVAKWLSENGLGWTHLLASPLEGIPALARDHLPELAALEQLAPAASTGETLLHFDIRADNVLLTDQGAIFVDWPHAHIGAAWVDVVFFAPSVAMQGGPDLASLLAMHPAAQHASPAAIDAVLAAVAGFFIERSLQAPPPGLAGVRLFQRAQGDVALRWLARRRQW